ncbi:MAG: ATP-binding cassette domain-containing protein, partial [Bacteroidales bacterium]|nr:ATP-binding cassette domain-containing protein [Bacteroidales bacterium]
ITDLSLQVYTGQIFGILGPNGSGKTTTLSIAMGILQQDKGEFFWFGEKADHHSRKQIGSLIEVPHFFPYLSLIQNLSLIADIKGFGKNDMERVLNEVKLFNRRNSKFRTLSLGMKQRLGIAATLLGNPAVLVLDEPTNGLDPEGIAEVRELITEQAGKGKTIIMASHILSEVEKVCSHVAILKSGRLIEQGEVRTIIGGEVIIELTATNFKALTQVLDSCDFLEWKKINQDNVLVSLKDGKNAEDLNRFIFLKGVTLSGIITHKKTLESQFLELVKG